MPQGDAVCQILDDVLPRRGGYLAMLKAYVDRGQKASPTDEVMCAACTIFKRTPYKQFLRPWNRMLRRWRAGCFHATDFYPGGGEFERDTDERKRWYDEDSKAIPAMIGENVTRVLVVAFRPREFAERASALWKERFGTDVYGLAVQMLLVFNGFWLREKCPSESFAYFRERGDDEDGAVDDAVRSLRNSSEYGPLVKVISYSTVEKGEARGTEASDFVAWQWNKHAVERLGRGLDPRKDFEKFARLTEHCGKVSSAFVTGEKLDTFFGVIEREVRAKLKANDANEKAKAAAQ